MSPTFSPNTHSYTCSTTNASDSVSATAAAGVSKILTVNGEEVPFGSVSWQSGQNTVVISTYYDGVTRETYIVTVTKS